MKKYLALLLFVLMASVSFGQDNYQDVVYLKNGSIIRGMIVEQVPNKSIKIETGDRNVFVFKFDEIERITKEQIQGSDSRSTFGTGEQEGFVTIIEFGYGVGVGDFGRNRLFLNFLGRYKFNPYFSLGFGTGLRYYFDAEAALRLRYDFDAEAALLPTILDFRATFMDNNVSPYLSLGLGYSFDATNSFNAVGFLVNPAVGVSYTLSNNAVMNIGIGYEIQRMELFDWHYVNKFTANLGAMCINVGVSF